MKERPILFKGEMVRAILDGRKTQTRRVVNVDRLTVTLRGQVCGDMIFAGTKAHGKRAATMNRCGDVSVLADNGEWLGVKPGEFDFNCPYCDGSTFLLNENGKQTWCIHPNPEQRLWVKETFAVMDGAAYDDGKSDPCAVYRATDTSDFTDSLIAKWRPSIFMPRWASRITLEVVSVRVERLNDISLADVEAEGTPYSLDPSMRPVGSRTEQYAALWDSINGKTYPWSSNPFVWVIEFRVMNEFRR